MGAIGTVSASKSDNMGTWFVNVSAAILPGAGESVYQANYPLVVMLDSGGNAIGSFMLMNTSGTTWAGSSMAPGEPAQVKVEVKFVSATLEKMANL